ncbi:hypothetical protein PQ469_05895 [Mucilaginibacter sp. KACC 22773]|uniref:hypothetical protein n=1 Tax=Mucilaginibacter sp. KACC 22773 TaxID=3025671 RepID=UPI002364FE98|nr:hypothetical protein [Mucilaginibacter sp. KACC 22773]WDF79534.1 hypothetical protein PQ469_05895 [Mucilaginibacter sp. KACC 22773]
MNTLSNTTAATLLPLAGGLLLPVFNNQVVNKPARTIYYVDAAIFCGDSIEVDYTLNDEWFNTSIEFQTLRAFILSAGLNDYCFDSSDHAGEHVQTSGSIDLDIYTDVYLNDAVKAYLQSIKAGQYNLN